MNDGFLKIIFDIVTSIKRAPAINLVCVSLFIIIISFYYSEYIPNNVLLYPLTVLVSALGLGSLTGLLINKVIDGALKLFTIFISKVMKKNNEKKEQEILRNKNTALISNFNECYKFLSDDACEILIQLTNEPSISVDLSPVVQKLNMNQQDKRIFYNKKAKFESIKALIDKKFIMVVSKLQMNRYVVKLNPVLSSKLLDIKKSLVSDFLNSVENVNDILALFESNGVNTDIKNTVPREALSESFRPHHLATFVTETLDIDSTILTFKYGFKIFFEELLGCELNDTVHIL